MMWWMHAYPHYWYWPCHLRYYWWMTALTQCTHPRSLHHWGRYVGDVTRHAPPPGWAPHARSFIPSHTGVGRRTVGWRGRAKNSHAVRWRAVVEEWERLLARLVRELPLKGKGDLDWSNQVEWFELRVIPENIKNSAFDFLCWLRVCNEFVYTEIYLQNNQYLI